MSIKLTSDQEASLIDIKGFLFNENKKEFILTGGSGSGKSTLVRYIVDNLPEYMKPIQLLRGEDCTLMPHLTATTNEAATVLSDASDMEASTVHSFFKFRFNRNYKTGNLDLVTKHGVPRTNVLLIIDEAFMLTKEMRQHVLGFTCNDSKILYVGDSEQLDAIGDECDVDKVGIGITKLITNMRQGGDEDTRIEIANLGILFRDAVISGVMPTLDYIDSKHIKYLDGPAFQNKIDDSFSADNYKSDKRILAFTNDRVIEYNTYVRELQNGSDGYKEGEILTSNNAITEGQEIIAKNNSEVKITHVRNGSDYGLDGVLVTATGLGGKSTAGIIPNSIKAAKSLINKYAKNKQWSEMFALQDKILDLRPRFASTVYKAQGGTLDEVYIDLNDITSNCRNTKKKARALYVAITRAKSMVYLYGEL